MPDADLPAHAGNAPPVASAVPDADLPAHLGNAPPVVSAGPGPRAEEPADRAAESDHPPPRPAGGAGEAPPGGPGVPTARRDHRGPAGLGLSAAGLTCFLLVALLGPSVMQPALPGSAGQPPYSLVVHPSAYLVIALTVAGVVLTVAGLALCALAARRGWTFRPRLLLVAGAIAAGAFALMPPVGSADHLNYAAYGRMAVTGNDPYVTTARSLPADPVAHAVQDWRDTPTVYGPIATAQQTLASLVGGTSVRLTVFVMSLTNALAFVAAGLLLYRTARGDPGRELRAVLLWTANPLLLFELIGGAHNDVLAIAFAVAGLVAFGLPDPLRPRPGDGRSLSRCVSAGVLIGAGAAIKINVAIAGGGPLLVLVSEWWRSRGTGESGHRTGLGPTAARVAALCASAAAVTGLAYLMAGPHSFDQLGRASKSVSLATPWHLLAGTGGGLLVTVSRSGVRLGSVLLTLVLVALLLRALPRPHVGGLTDPIGDETFRIAAALALAWLFAAPYALPWYDGLGWATIALLAWSRFDGLLLVRTGVLALAYLPARDPRHAGLPHDLDWLVTVVRAQVTPWALTLTLIALIAAATRWSPRAQAPGCSPRAPAGSPR
ncbi:polyprenol phosphomannose-dependent alpha 1,6 mannosyltransferase MptB [Actinoallomurus sp. NBC_01490]|uniref:polyprenol phosphomannose-dependent alpha 1,6 mannosyltransferase MptB n=1 Tax=Actinoallomurus sp. NBC_01490 TaxID=2903557 RepID=UPI002E2EB401|nr:polyprenol phosphomannose-dependent alpha 1,6 mannosyltransferase MptB [Actinoallomurus sp. NBC_01490]